MATASYSILGQQQPVGSNLDLFICPASTQAVLSTIVVSNTTATSATATVYVRKASGSSAAAAGTNNAIMYAAPISANSLQTLTIGITLSAYDTITVASGTSGAITFHAFGTVVA
jgi:hypothetical protein